MLCDAGLDVNKHKMYEKKWPGAVRKERKPEEEKRAGYFELWFAGQLLVWTSLQ